MQLFKKSIIFFCLFISIPIVASSMRHRPNHEVYAMLQRQNIQNQEPIVATPITTPIVRVQATDTYRMLNNLRQLPIAITLTAQPIQAQVMDDRIHLMRLSRNEDVSPEAEVYIDPTTGRRHLAMVPDGSGVTCYDCYTGKPLKLIDPTPIYISFTASVGVLLSCLLLCPPK